MRIKKVVLHNVCQHRDLTVEFGAGVAGVLARNGGGKSNLLHAMKRGFTGTTENEGTNEDDLSWGGESGFIEEEFLVGAVAGSIKRDIKTARTTMKYGSQTFKTATDANNALTGVFGMPAKTLMDIAFAPQGQIEGVLFQTTSERSRSLQFLFGSEKAAKVHQALGEELSGLTINSKQGQIDQLVSQLKNNVTGVLERAAAELAAVQAGVLSDTARSTNNKLIAAAKAYKTNEPILRSLLQEQQRLNEQFVSSGTKLLSLESNITTFSGIADSMKSDYDAARHRIAAGSSYAAILLQKQNLTNEIAAGEDRLRCPQPVDPNLAEEYQRLMFAVHASNGELLTSRKLVENFKSGQKQCPTCLQPVSESHLQAHVSRVGILTPQVEEAQLRLKKIIDAQNTYLRERAVWGQTQREVSARLIAARAALNDIAAVPGGAGELPSDKETVKVYEDLLKSLHDFNANRASVDATYGHLAAALPALRLRIEEVKASMGAAVHDDEFKRAETLIELDRCSSIRAAELTGLITNLTSQKTYLEGQISELQEEEKKIEPLRRWKDLCERARLVVHHEQLPRVVAQAYLKAINAKLSFYIEMFEVPFLLKLEDDLSVSCTFSGGFKVTAGRLSGGQRVMAGIAFRFAVYDIFASSLGIMVLDEPTAFLDAAHVDCVVKLLEKVKSYSRSAGLQLIVSTHEPKLMSVVDTEVRL